jgi:hypothetical protein
MLLIILAILTLAVLYSFPIRGWMSRWGTTPSDLTRVMAGDGLLVDPTFSYTMAATVNAPPEDIWPWLLQMGYQRGGLYSYDWLDRLFGYLDRPSATRILPEFQHLAVGDAIPLQRSFASNRPETPGLHLSVWRSSRDFSSFALRRTFECRPRCGR